MQKNLCSATTRRNADSEWKTRSNRRCPWPYRTLQRAARQQKPLPNRGLPPSLRAFFHVARSSVVHQFLHRNKLSYDFVAKFVAGFRGEGCICSTVTRCADTNLSPRFMTLMSSFKSPFSCIKRLQLTQSIILRAVF